MVTHIKILEVNLFAFAYRLFHEDFSPINGAFRYLPKDQLRDGCELGVPPRTETQRFEKYVI